MGWHWRTKYMFHSHLRGLGRVLTALLFAFGIAPVRGAQKSEIRTVYIIPSSHWDLGFKLPPEEQLDDIKQHLDGVIQTAKKDPDFRWVVESVWQVQAWLDRTHDPQAIAEFANLVRSGQIELSAAWGSEHTEFMGAEQLNRFIYASKDVDKRLGVTTDLAMMDDVPGFTLRLPQVLARSGIKYFVTGSNLFIGGGTSLHPGKMPFYWRSPDGSTVLTWQTQSKNGGYVEAMADYYLDPSAHYYNQPADQHFYPKEWEGQPQLEIMQRGVDKLLAEYSKAKYPYDAAMVLYVHDFVPASYEENGLLPAVRAWNAAGKEPRLVVATPAEFFSYLEKKYGNPFPAYSGDFSGMWSEIKTNSPGITADARWVQDYLPQAEELWSLLSFRAHTQFPADAIADAATKMLKYDEHSGAGQAGWPKVMTLEQTNRQNEEYSMYAKTSRAEVRAMMMSGVAEMFSADRDPNNTPKCVVYNPLSWKRSELVQVRPPAPELTAIRDAATGMLVTVQQEANGALIFAAADVPPAGFRTYTFERPEKPPASVVLVADDVLDNNDFTVRLRASDGSIASLIDKQVRKELVKQDPNTVVRMGQMVRWNFANYLPNPEWRPVIRHLRGPLTDELVVTRPGTWWPATRILLENGMKQVTIDNVYDRSRMPFVPLDKNADFYSFEFPFQFDSTANVMVDDGIGFHNLPKDYLPGAKVDQVAAIHAIVLEDSADVPPSAVTLLQRENFFDVPISWPGSGGEPPTFLNEIRVNALRKADQADTADKGVVTLPTVEPGYGPLYSSSFALTVASKFDPVASWRQGWEFNVPLVVSMLSSDRKPRSPSGSFFDLSAPNVAILAFRPSTDGNPDHYMMRLQEIAGRGAVFSLSSKLKVAGAAETSMTEDQVIHSALNLSQLSIGAHETLTLQLTIPHGANDWSQDGAQ